MQMSSIESSPSRREFLVGGVAFAAIPSSATAEDKGELSNLIGMHRLAKTAARQAGDIEEAIYNQPARPALATIQAHEFHYRHYPMRLRSYCTRFLIDREMDEDKERIDRWFEFFSEDDEGKATVAPQSMIDERRRRLLENAAEREKLLGLFEEREAVFKVWSDAVGLTAASAEAERLYDVCNALDDAIMAFQPQTLDDILMKAGFLQAEYEGNLSAEAANAFIYELASIGRAG